MFDLLTDPFLRAPVFGSLLMCLGISLMGVVLLLRRHTLVSETLSHATYPGIVLGVALGADAWVFVGAFVFAHLALKTVRFLEKQGRVKGDAALCFVLAVFFGIGLVGATALQGIDPVRMRTVTYILLGQVATMQDSYIAIYGGLSLLISAFLIFFYRPLQVMLFDPLFAKAEGFRLAVVERVLFALLVASIIASLKSVGIVLMSGMLIGPAVAARSWTDQLPKIFCLAALFGGVSAVLGNAFALHKALPSGPVIVLVSAICAVGGLLLAPHRGILFRWLRQRRFQRRCLEENLLKELWKEGSLQKEGGIVRKMARQGWLERRGVNIMLTPDGEQKARGIVRLHRLWELYLAQLVGLAPQDVHRHAEEMEHILTPDMEAMLTRLLEDPKEDPHAQPIPGRLR